MSKLIWTAYLNYGDDIVLIARSRNWVVQPHEVLVPSSCVRKMFPNMVWLAEDYRVLSLTNHPILAHEFAKRR